MGPVKRYRAGVEPSLNVHGDGDEEEVAGNGLSMKRETGHTSSKSRRVVQPQILTDANGAAGTSFGTKVETHTQLMKPVTATVKAPRSVEGVKEEEKEKEESDSSGDSDSGSDSDSDDSDSSDGDDAAPPAMITFVPKSKRVDMATKAEEKARHEMAQQIKEKKERQKRSRDMASESVARKVVEQEGPGSEDEEGYPDDTDSADDQAAYQEWRTREILRLNRDMKNEQ